jgi:Tol biopolymer transport system component
VNRKRLRWAAGALVFLSFAAPVLAAELVSQVAPSQVSVTGGGSWINRSFSVFYLPSLSDDGRYAVFHSYETNLVPGERDLNLSPDLYVRDLLTGSTALVSHAADSPATTANGASYEAVISGDGRWIAFNSGATDLLPGPPEEPSPERIGIYLYDRVAEVTTRVLTRPANDLSELRISDDGRWIAFASRATDLVPGQQQLFPELNVFLYDRELRSFELVSHASSSATTVGDGISGHPSLSADGRWVAFLSTAQSLAPGKPPGGEGVFLWDRESGTVTLAGVLAGPYPQVEISADGRYLAFGDANGTSLYDRVPRTVTRLAAVPSGGDALVNPGFAINADGRWVVLISAPGNLLPPQPGGTSAPGAYLYDRVTGTFTLVSRKGSPASAPGFAAELGISADGRLVTFSSLEPDLVPGQADANGAFDVFLFDRDSGSTTLVSRSGVSTTTAAEAFSYGPVISADGSRVVFSSPAGNLAIGAPDRNQSPDVFVYTVPSASLEAVSQHAPDLASQSPEARSDAAAVSGDGRWVVFTSYADHLVGRQSGPRFSSKVFLRDRVTRTTVLVSHAAGLPTRMSNGNASNPSITADGRWVLFSSDATDLVAGTTLPPGKLSYFLYDRLAGTTTLVARTEVGPTTLPTPEARITPDGRWIVFASNAADLVPGQQGHRDLNIYLRDRQTGGTTLVSHTAVGPRVTSRRRSYAPRISDDGRWVAFASLATDLVPRESDVNGLPDLYLWDRATGKTVLVSHARSSPLVAGSLSSDLYSSLFAMSADGRFLAFVSSSVIDGIERGRKGGLYLYDRTTAGLTRIADQSLELAINADGRAVAFAAPTSTYIQIRVYDRLAGTTTLLSRSTSGNGGATGHSREPAISADGRFVAFSSTAPDLVSGQPAPGPHQLPMGVFLADRQAGATLWISAPPPGSIVTPDFSFTPILSPSGRQIAFTSYVDLAPEDLNNDADVYGVDLAAGWGGG